MGTPWQMMAARLLVKRRLLAFAEVVVAVAAKLRTGHLVRGVAAIDDCLCLALQCCCCTSRKCMAGQTASPTQAMQQQAGGDCSHTQAMADTKDFKHNCLGYITTAFAGSCIGLKMGMGLAADSTLGKTLLPMALRARCHVCSGSLALGTLCGLAVPLPAHSSSKHSNQGIVCMQELYLTLP